MELNHFILRIVLLAIPGIITLYIYRSLKGKNANKKNWEDIFEIMIFSLINYSIFYLAVCANNYFHNKNDNIVFLNAILDEKIHIYWPEIIWTSAIGFINAFILSAADTFKIINKIGRLAKVTKRYGDEDVWEFVHNLDEIDWVFVRDHRLDLVYYGFIQLYSDSEKEREILINDVDIYSNSTGTFIYSTKSLYICRNKYDLTIEIPNEDKQRGQK